MLQTDMFLDGHGKPAIRDDPEFNGWRGKVPRLWFLSERQAVQIGDTQIYGAATYATTYSRTVIESALPTINDVGHRGTTTFVRTNIDLITPAVDTGTRSVSLVRPQLETALPTINDTGTLLRPGSNIVQRIVDSVD